MTTRPFTFFRLLLAVALLGGCSSLDNCPDAPDKSILRDNPDTNPEPLVYASVPWEGPRDAFPAKTCLYFVHHLGSTPDLVQSYLSFTATGSDVTENTGNQGRIKCVDDDEIVIKNDTCEEDFFIRVTAIASGSTHTAESCKEQFAKEDADPDKRCPPAE